MSFASITAAGTDLRAQDPTLDDLGPAMGAALDLSPTRAHRLVRGLVETAADVDQSATEVGALVEWSAREGSDQRRVVIDAMRTSGGDVLLVDRVSRLPRTEARPFLAEYLDAGGRRRDIATWLATVGGVLREHGRLDDDHSGAVIDWIADAAEDVVDAIGEAVETVVDALIEAGETIADVISEIVDFTREQMENLVEALVAAGETIANLVVEAANATVAVFKKTIKALVDIGTTIAEVLVDVVNEAVDLLGEAINALREIGRSFVSIIREAAELVAGAFQQVVATLLDIGRAVVDIIGDAIAAAGAVLVATVRALIDIGRTIATLITDVVTGRVSLLDALAQALRDIGTSVTTLLDEARNAVAGAVRSIAASLARIGEAVVDLATWAANAAVEFAREVVRALIEVGNSIAQLVTAVAQSALSVMRTIIDGFYAIGRTFAQLLADLADIASDLLAKVLEAAFELGATLVEFVAETIKDTYAGAKRLVEAALEAGAALADLLVEAARGTYFHLRRMVFSVLDAVGLGEVFDWALSQLEAGVSAVFREVVLAVRFAGGVLTDALDWAVDQTEQAFEALVDAWESVGESLVDLYEWASQLASDVVDEVWERLGRITNRLRNSVTYVLNYLENDFLPGVRRFVAGLVEAGYALADLLVRVLHRSAQFVAEVVAELLEAGVTLAALLAAAAIEGDVDAMLAAVRDLDSTWDDIMQAADEAGEDIAADVARAAEALGEALDEMLDAAWEVGGGLFGLIVSELMNLIATYRPLTDTEKEEAERVFEDAIDLDVVSISQESLDNTIIFEIQAAFQRLGGDAPNARAFVTGTLINMRADQGIDMETLVHELTHVWQNFEVGPIYLSEAIHAQATNPDAYNYGYTDDETGAGAEGPTGGLQAAGGDFEAFNREQQGQIMQHYYRRRFVETPALDTADWQPYVDVVRAA
ncbi:MAG TPA: methyl-accepting chemotaxis protein [Nitriliruptoraceae bacterium]|nr:methyl-accepting chemotaxis protein [Nitriliruptoraceae bacterium]